MVSAPNLPATLANMIADYRAGEIPKPDAGHVERWIAQFPAEVRDSIITELVHVFSKTYFTRKNVQTFIDSIVTNANFVGQNPTQFWQGVKVLNLQTAGNSQNDMIALLAESLQRQCGLTLSMCGVEAHTFLYLDDALFSGGRIRSDLEKWIIDAAPAKANLTILVIASHHYGEWDTGKKLGASAKKAGKSLDIVWRRCAVFENRKAYITNSDIVCPTAIPTDQATQDYLQSLTQPPLIRTVGGRSPIGVFSGETGRHLLEQQFLRVGIRVRNMCPHFDKFMRPLGRMMFESLGFGSTIVTYRNCPNNAPLVLWAGDPWYPLFPRKNN